MTESYRTNGVPLTPQEEEYLQTALDRGYFDVPRGITTVALAKELGVSDRECTVTLRRATAKVISYGQDEVSAQEESRRRP